VLLYLTDVEHGGETVFTHSPPKGKSTMMDEEAALKMVREQNLTGGLLFGSWEERMVAECQVRYGGGKHARQ